MKRRHKIVCKQINRYICKVITQNALRKMRNDNKTLVMRKIDNPFLLYGYEGLEYIFQTKDISCTTASSESGSEDYDQAYHAQAEMKHPFLHSWNAKFNEIYACGKQFSRNYASVECKILIFAD